MSTAQLLDFSTQYGRTQRREVLADIRGRIRVFRGRDRLVLQAVLADLEKVHKDHSLTGAQKSARFGAIVRRAVKPSTPIA